jgi:hypothetical protein
MQPTAYSRVASFQNAAPTGRRCKHVVRASRRDGVKETAKTRAARQRKRRHGATIEDALTALWEASDRVCGNGSWR